MNTKNNQVGIVGALGMVGQELTSILESRKEDFPHVRFFEAETKKGCMIPFRGEEVACEVLGEVSGIEMSMLFFATSSQYSKEVAPWMEILGCKVIDNSSAFRSDPSVPLVIPEINGNMLSGYSRKIVSNPNCSTIILLMAIAPIWKHTSINKIIVSTYQAISGSGKQALDEMMSQTKNIVNGMSCSEPEHFKHRVAFNVFSHESYVDLQGYNEEERKIIEETNKILDVEMDLTVTCIRVPVARTHSESVYLLLDEDVPEEKIRSWFMDAPGVKIVDDRRGNYFPMPSIAEGKDDVFVGRIRKDLNNPKGVWLFVCGDQLRKGAALNAVQIGMLLAGK